MKRKMSAGSTSQTMEIFVRDTSQAATVAGLTGLTSATAGLTWYYHRQGSATNTAVTLAAGTLGTWSSGGIVAVDATNSPGKYEIGIPNAVLATGATYATMTLKGAANMPQIEIEIELDAVNYQSNTSFVASVPAVVGAVGSVTNPVTVGTNSDKTGYSLTQTFPANFAALAITPTTGLVSVGTNSDKTGYSLTQTFPSNFSSLVISAGGVVNAATLTNADKTGYSLSQAFPTNFSSLAITPTTGLVSLAGTQTFSNTGTWTGNLTGSVGSINGVTFPANFSSTVISAAGAVNCNVVDWVGLAPNALIGGNVPVSVNLGSNAPAGWLNAAAFAAGAITPTAVATGVYPMQVGPDFTNVKQATAPTTLANITVPTVAVASNVPTAAQNANAVWTDSLAADFNVLGSVGIRIMSGSSLLDSVIVEAGTPTLNARQALCLMLAGDAGTITGAGSQTIVINGAGTSTARMTLNNPDSFGDRSNLVLNPPA